MSPLPPDPSDDATALPPPEGTGVAVREGRLPLLAGLAGAVLLGGIVLASLLSAQARQREALAGITGAATAGAGAGAGAGGQTAPVPEPPELFPEPPVPPPLPDITTGTGPASWPAAPEPASPPPAASPPPPLPPPPPQPVVRVPEYLDPPAPPPPPPPAPGSQRPNSDVTQRLRSPALVVDLGVAAPAPAEAPAGVPPAATGAGNDAFAAQVGAADVPGARAGAIRNPRTTVPQGAMIAAVLETAINSDLPGFVRAVVSRDVRGFDGQAVLIPRGSRLIGQYRSEVALGQSRALVIWTRLIRPDGVTIQLASPGTDPLGRAGLSGEVDRHTLQRYGPGLLTTILSAAVSDRGSNQIVIGTAQAAGQALQPEPIKPTVTVRQGAAIQVFVARDLDFGTVAPGPDL